MRHPLFLLIVTPLLLIRAALGQEVTSTQPAGLLPITHDAVYGEEPADFSPEVQRQLYWFTETSYVERSDDGWSQVTVADGEAIPFPFFDEQAGRKQIAEQLDLPEAAQRRIVRDLIRTSLDNPDDLTRPIVFEHQGQIYRYVPVGSRFERIAGEDAAREVIHTGPGGRFVYCIRNNDLYAISTGSGRQRRLTRGADTLLLNGKLDWVYQEEIYGRGRWRGYWPSDDDRYVAYLQLDESAVPVYEIVREVERHPRTERTHYPKSGDPNPTVRMGVVSTTWGTTRWVDLSAYDGIEILITQVSWTPDGRVLFSVQDREQRWLDLCEYDPGSGRQRVLIREVSPAWIAGVPHPHWLDDGTFLWSSDRDGYRHLYHYDRDGNLLTRLTAGPWEVRDLHGCDESAGWVYLSGTRDTELELHAYRVRLDGTAIERLTEPGSTHAVTFSPDFRWFFDRYSNVSTPTKVALRATGGGLVRMISDDRPEDLDRYDWVRPELVHLSARDGFRLHGQLIKPPNYEPGRRYPVWVMVYGGPGSQTVWNRWGGSRMLRDQLLASYGYVVWKADPRSGGGHGARANWAAYQRLGEVELRDIEDGVQWLIDEGIADQQRVGITGHSYGGYMTAYALTHSTRFRLGIAGAPVTDWLNYDTVYTERYMRIPNHNPDGYQSSSVVTAAGDLSGRLLIVHGLLDDNVHFQNAVQLIEALQKQGQQFDVMVYPRDRHGIWNGREHYRDLTYEYIREHL